MRESTTQTNKNFKPVKGFEDYLINEDGVILSKKHKRDLYTKLSNSGYKVVTLFKDKKRYQLYVHRLVAQTFICCYDSDLTVNHIDNNKLNNNICNLEWVTLRDNIIHYHRYHKRAS